MTERTENGVCNALKIGVSCICRYMMSYCIRNLLTVSSAEILKEGALSKERLGFLSAMYYGIYAFGQLINGAVGDVVTPKNGNARITCKRHCFLPVSVCIKLHNTAFPVWNYGLWSVDAERSAG